MTLPDERTRAVLMSRDLLLDLCDPRKTPRVPKALRDRARSALRHYPMTSDFYHPAEAFDVPPPWLRSTPCAICKTSDDRLHRLKDCRGY